MNGACAELQREDLSGLNVTLDTSMGPNWVYHRLARHMRGFRLYLWPDDDDAHTVLLELQGEGPISHDTAVLRVVGHALDYAEDRPELDFAPLGVVVRKTQCDGGKEGANVTAWLREYPDLLPSLRSLLGQVIRGRQRWIEDLSVVPWQPLENIRLDWAKEAESLLAELQALSQAPLRGPQLGAEQPREAPVSADEKLEARVPVPEEMAKRRQEVEKLYWWGLLDDTIARRLHVSVPTVRRDRRELGLSKRKS